MKIRTKITIVEFIIVFGFTLILGITIFFIRLSIDLKNIENQSIIVLTAWNKFNYERKSLLTRKLTINEIINNLTEISNNFDIEINKLNNKRIKRLLTDKTGSKIYNIIQLWNIVKIDFRYAINFLKELKENNLKDEIEKYGFNEAFYKTKFTIDYSDNKQKLLFFSLNRIQKNMETLDYSQEGFTYNLQELAKNIQVRVDGYINNIIILSIIFTIISIILGISFSILISKNLSDKFNLIIDSIKKVSQGDFSTRLNINTNDEFENIAKNFNMFLMDLKSNVDSILNFIKNIGKIITKEFNLPDIYKLIIKLVLENTNADGAVIYIYNKKSNHLKLKAINKKNLCPDYFMNIIKLSKEETIKKNSKEIIEKTIKETVIKNQPVFIKNIFQFYRIKQKKNNSINSIINMPIIISQKLFGILSIIKYKQNDYLNDLNFTHIKAFTDYAALIIDNFMKYKEMINITQKRQKQKIELLKYKNEMDLVKRIQTAIIPKNIKHPDFDISAKMIPAVEIGGDYYDFCFDEEGNLWISIGDVTGHGLTSGLIMMMAQTANYVSIHKYKNASPSDILESINNVLFNNIQKRLKEDYMMTFLEIKYTGKGLFEFAGSHLDILIYRTEKNIIDVITSTGIFLNIEETIKNITENSKFNLNIGDTMILYTDGIIEAKNNKNQVLNMDKWIEMIKTHINKDVDKMEKSLIHDVMKWCNHKYNDDITLIIMRRKK